MTEQKLNNTNTAVRTIAPEDIRTGMYVSVLHVIGQYIPYFCDSELAGGTVEPIRFRRLPLSKEYQPLLVTEVCLPFVLVRTARGRTRSIDVRRYRIAQVSSAFGEAYFKAIDTERQKRLEQKGEKSEPAASEPRT